MRQSLQASHHCVSDSGYVPFYKTLCMGNSPIHHSHAAVAAFHPLVQPLLNSLPSMVVRKLSLQNRVTLQNRNPNWNFCQFLACSTSDLLALTAGWEYISCVSVCYIRLATLARLLCRQAVAVYLTLPVVVVGSFCQQTATYSARFVVLKYLLTVLIPSDCLPTSLDDSLFLFLRIYELANEYFRKQWLNDGDR